jgi:hypothetical protein
VSARKNRCGGQRTARLQINDATPGSSIPVGAYLPDQWTNRRSIRRNSRLRP